MPGRRIIAFSIGVSLLAAAAQAQDAASLTAGRRLAAARCGSCHAIDRIDQSPNPQAPRFRDLGARFPFEGLRGALAEGMIIGHPQMPVMHLTRFERDDLVAYLKSLQERPGRRGRNRGPA